MLGFRGMDRNLRLILLCALLTIPVFFSVAAMFPEGASAFKAVSGASDKKLPIYSVETERKMVSITFDAAWGGDDTQELLRILKEHDVKATFFLCGYWIDEYENEVKRIYSGGHDIGNHGDTHAHMAQLDIEGVKAELKGAHDKVRKLLGIEMNLFRPPYGEYNNTVIQAAEELDYCAVQWDVDSLDWKNIGHKEQINQVLNHKNLKNGSIILFHNDAKYTAGTLEPIIIGLKEMGYEIVPVSELINKKD